MKILQIIPFFPPDIGGMETFSGNLVRSLQERGHQNHIFTSRKSQQYNELMDYFGATVQRVDFMNAIYKNNLPQIIASKKKLKELKRTLMPDVVLVHIGAPVAILELSTPEPDIPLVVVAHDLPPSGEKSPTLQRLFNKSRFSISISEARLQDTKFIAPEASNRARLVYSNRPARHYPEGISKSTHPTVIMTGRLVETKGFDLAVEAFQWVRHEIPEAELILVGDGPLFTPLQEQIREHDLQDAITLTGYLSEERLTELYCKAWISLVPSRHSESLGLVALEAMHAALPVIASRTGGLKEVVEHDKTGLLIPINDSSALAEAIIQLCRDKARAVRMGQAGQQRIKELFDWENCVTEYENILREAIDDDPA